MLENYWPFYVGGISIAVIALLLVIFTGKFISITRGYVAVCSFITKQSYFTKPDIGGALGVRTMFIVGVVIGGFLAALYNGGFNPSWALGKFDQIWQARLLDSALATKAAVLITGGFLWGYGSRMAGGCTSGNSIAGLSRGSLASLLATMGFMIGGVSLTFLIDALFGKGV